MSRQYRYDRSFGQSGTIVLRGVPEGKEGNEVTIEMVAISKFIWGRGMSVNSIFNTGSAFLKFQHADAKENDRRAKLTAKVWRACKINEFDVSRLPIRQTGSSIGLDQKEFTEDFTTIVDRISTYNSVIMIAKQQIKAQQS